MSNTHKSQRKQKNRARHETLPLLPIVFGLPEIEAAVSLGISPTKFREMIAVGLMPKPRTLAGKLVYDVDELRAAFKAMPHHNEQIEADTWADILPDGK